MSLTPVCVRAPRSMITKQLDCYVRPYRRRWALTQKELAHLLGAKSSTGVSRLERQLRHPSLKVAFAFEIIFGTPAIEMFPSLFTEMEEAVMARAYDLYEQLQGNGSTSNRIKLDFLEERFERAKERALGRSV
jgi:DNA-binding XRE family transcriptional regulator